MNEIQNHLNSVADDSCYPYEAKAAPQATCRATKHATLKSMRCEIAQDRPTDSLYKMGPAYSLFNETAIMYEIKNNGPVQGEKFWHFKRYEKLTFWILNIPTATMWVYQDFFSYKSGIYRHSSHGDNRLRGFHSVKLVGWGEERFGYDMTKYWVSYWGLYIRTPQMFMKYLSLNRLQQIHGEATGASTDILKSWWDNQSAFDANCIPNLCILIFHSAVSTNVRSKATSSAQCLNFTTRSQKIFENVRVVEPKLRMSFFAHK